MFGKSKQAYYKQKESGFDDLAKADFIEEYVFSVRSKCPGSGGKKLWLKYQFYFGKELSLGRDAFLRVLSERNLLLRKRRKSCKTTDSRHQFPLYPDLVKDLEVNRLNQVWVSDITYIRMDSGFVFLSLITDVYSRQIIGWSVGSTLETIYPMEALRMALNGREGKVSGLIHHSDRGSQYASTLYTNALKLEGITISMTESGNPKDNAIAERVNGILKTEFLNFYDFKDIEEVRQVVSDSIHFYNNERYHSSIDMLTPNQAALRSGKIPKRWKSYKDKYRTPA